MPRPATQPGDRDFEEICPRVGYHSLIEKPVRAVAARFTWWREATVSETQPSAQAGGATKRENVGVHPERTLPPGVRRGGAGYRAMWPAGGTRSCQRAGGDAVGDRLGAASGEAPLPPLSVAVPLGGNNTTATCAPCPNLDCSLLPTHSKMQVAPTFWL